MAWRKPNDDGGGWKPSTSKALSKVCRKRWRTVDLAAGSPTPPMRINCANGDGKSSLWVFGGQGAATSSADSSRTHQGVKIRTLAKRTCFNDFFEFDTNTLEWRDHVQAGVCPTSRRGHTATLVLGRRSLEPPPPPPRPVAQAQLSKGTPDAPSAVGTSAGGGSNNRDATNGVGNATRYGQLEGGEATAGGGGGAGLTHRSPRRGRAAAGDDEAAALRGRGSELGSERRLPRNGEAGEGSFGDGGRQGAGRERGKRKGAEGGTDAEPKERVSREMFVIGGAGTDPIRNMEVVYPQLWIFDFDCCTWTCVEAGEGGKKRGNGNGNGGGSGSGGSGGGGSKSLAGPGPPAVFDHTATLSGGKHIVVIGGVMVGTALNSQVYVLSLDTLQWSTLDPNPLGFSGPAIYGHTAVEDPTHPGRLVVFGGRGGSHWNTEVITFNTKNRLWSMAVCEANSPPSSSSGGSPPRDIKGEDNVSARKKPSSSDTVETETTQPRPGSGFSSSAAPTCTVFRERTISARKTPTTMPHQRHGHTSFVWDPRNAVLTGRGLEDARGVCRGGGLPASVRHCAGEKEEQNKPGGAASSGRGTDASGASGRISPKRSRSGGGGGGGGNSRAGTALPRAGGGGGGISGRSGGGSLDDPFPSPCIVTFGGSALRTGGGYAHAVLHALESLPLDGKEDGEDSVEEEEEGDGVAEEERGRVGPKTSSVGFMGALEAASTTNTNTKRPSLSKFQNCTKAVILKVHSLRQLGNERLDFGNEHIEGDLSYVEFKIRSVILGDGGRKTKGGASSGDDSKKPLHATKTLASPAKGTTTGHDRRPHPGAGRLGVFPTGYEQVKAFLADSRPAKLNRRPVSAPAHSEIGGGALGSSGGGYGGGGGGGAERKQARARTAVLRKTRRPGSAGAALGSSGMGEHADQFSVFPPVMLSAKPFSGSLLARSASKTTVGGGSTASVADVDSDGLQGQGPEGSEAVAAAEGGDRSSCRLLCPRPSSVGGGATMPTRVGRHGKPLLLPKPTLAAHNGRMLMEYEWAHAGFY